MGELGRVPRIGLRSELGFEVGDADGELVVSKDLGSCNKVRLDEGSEGRVDGVGCGRTEIQ